MVNTHAVHYSQTLRWIIISLVNTTQVVPEEFDEWILKNVATWYVRNSVSLEIKNENS